MTVKTRHTCPSHGAESPSYPQRSTKTPFHFIPRIPTSLSPWTLQSWPLSSHRLSASYSTYLDLFQAIGQSFSILIFWPHSSHRSTDIYPSYLDLFKVIGQSLFIFIFWPLSSDRSIAIYPSHFDLFQSSYHHELHYLPLASQLILQFHFDCIFLPCVDLEGYIGWNLE